MKNTIDITIANINAAIKITILEVINKFARYNTKKTQKTKDNDINA
jgi:hypothetical protein